MYYRKMFIANQSDCSESLVDCERSRFRQSCAKFRVHFEPEIEALTRWMAFEIGLAVQ